MEESGVAREYAQDDVAIVRSGGAIGQRGAQATIVLAENALRAPTLAIERTRETSAEGTAVASSASGRARHAGE